MFNWMSVNWCIGHSWLPLMMFLMNIDIQKSEFMQSIVGIKEQNFFYNQKHHHIKKCPFQWWQFLKIETMKNEFFELFCWMIFNIIWKIFHLYLSCCIFQICIIPIKSCTIQLISYKGKGNPNKKLVDYNSVG